jgi:transposase
MILRWHPSITCLNSIFIIPYLNAEQLKLEMLADLIEDNNDATLEELCSLLKAKTDITISRATMGRMSQRLKLTVKKNSTR